MELPLLTPQDLDHLADLENPKELLGTLSKKPPDLVRFFVAAAGDETWVRGHLEVMETLISWITNQYFRDHLLSEMAQKAADAIQKHHVVLDRIVPKNITIKVDGITAEANSLLWATSSEILRTIIRQEVRDKNVRTLVLTGIEPEIFQHVDEYVKTGAVEFLWKLDQPGIENLLKAANAWGLKGLMYLCEDLLKKYISQGNVVDKLIESDEEGWEDLRWWCMEKMNGMNLGVHFEKTPRNQFSFEFYNFKESAMTIFERVRYQITHLICAKDLAQDEHFHDVIFRIPKLRSLSLSDSRKFSDYLLDIPNDVKELDLSRCEWLNNKNLAQVIKFCPQLTGLKLASNKQLNYSAWTTLSQLKSLHHLDVSGDRQIGDEDLKVILQSCKEVLHLELEDCKGLTETGLSYIGKYAQQLTDLNLSRTNITDGALIDLSQNLPKLLTLKVQKSPSLTERGVLESVRGAPQLREIDFAKCNFPEGVRNQILEARPFLRVIS